MGRIVASFASLAALLTAPARADEINLLCTPKSGASCQLYIDTEQKYLTYCQSEFEDGASTKSDGRQYVQIDSGSVRFGDQSTVHVLDRYTGILSIEMKCVGSNKGAFTCAATGLGSVRFDPISCAKLTKKF